MTNRHREHPGWIASWEGPFRNWALKFFSLNKWRVDNIHSLDDLMQDAYLTFVRVYKAYPRVVEPANFMALFKRALRNEMIDKAKKNKSNHILTSLSDNDYEEPLIERIEGGTNNGYLNVLLDELPTELKMVLEMMVSEDTNLRYKKARTKLQMLAGIELDETQSLNSKLCWALKLPKVVDLIGRLRSALT